VIGLNRGPAVAFMALASFVPSPAATVGGLPTPAARIRGQQGRIDALAADLVAFWKEHGPDRELGGFHGTLDREGRPKPPTDKGLVQQARHLWTFSMWHRRREATSEVRALADGAYRFLVAHFRDPKDGEFVFKVDRAGKVVDPRKQLYAESFAIFALSEYAAAFGVAEAREHALACFRAIDARAHDAEHGGYDQRDDPGWMTKGAEKETNTHIHLLEAFTALFRLTRDPVVGSRLDELARVVATRIVQPAGYAQKELLRDWRPFGDPAVSYGHDLETAWLLLDAADALGRPDDAAIVGAARRMGEKSAREGYDPAHGGLFEEGVPGGKPTRTDKVWWVQAEALPGLFRLYERSGDSVQLDRIDGVLDWIERRQRDPEHGEWFWSLTADASARPHGDDKGEEWKASYHGLRATVFTSDWMKAWLEKDALVTEGR
jgi:mannobiose 2-epimerase